MPEELRPRVVLADDHEGMLQVFQRLLEPYCEIVGSVKDGRALLQAVASLSPDVVVVDVNIPAVNGIEACDLIRQSAPRTRVVIVTVADDAAIRQQAFSLGASAFVLKYRAADELLAAVRKR